MLQPRQVSARSQQSAYSETGDMSSVCIPCAGPVQIQAHYDDYWFTPITGTPVRIEDGNGVLLPGVQGGPTTLGLFNFGAEDGQSSVPGLTPALGTFSHPQAQRGPVTVTLPADPAAEDRIKELEQDILSGLNVFAQNMETAIAPWVQKWEETGWYGAVSVFFSGIGDGLTAWWEGEGDFWGSVWETVQAIPDAIYDGAVAAYDWSTELWANKGKIFDLFQAIAEGAIDTVQSLLESLVSLPGEIGEIITDLVQNSREWAGAMIEMTGKTRVLDVLFTTAGAIVFSLPPNFWAEALGSVGGFLIPEVIISIIFMVIAAFTAGGGGAVLAARLTAFAARTAKTLRSAGRAGKMVARVFEFIQTIYQKLVDLVWALKRGIDELVESATDVITRIVRRSGRRVKPPADMPCFSQPPNATRQEFLDQLQEQENAINNSDLSELIERRAAVRAQGAGALRDAAAQQTARDNWLRERIEELIDDDISPARAARTAAAEALRLDATHVLDIVAGGNPSAISGLQNQSVNRSLGSQWRTRVGSLDDALEEQSRRGGMKANVRMRPC